MRKAYWNMSLSNRFWAYKLMTDLWELVHRLQGPSLQTETRDLDINDTSVCLSGWHKTLFLEYWVRDLSP